MAKGNGGDFHQGVPDKHKGKKGDKSDDVRSSAEFRRLQDEQGSESVETSTAEMIDPSDFATPNENLGARETDGGTDER